MGRPITIVYGDLSVEGDKHGNVSITRQSSAQRVTVSLSEWEWLIAALDLLRRPVAQWTEPTLDEVLAR